MDLELKLAERGYFPLPPKPTIGSLSVNEHITGPMNLLLKHGFIPDPNLYKGLKKLTIADSSKYNSTLFKICKDIPTVLSIYPGGTFMHDNSWYLITPVQHKEYMADYKSILYSIWTEATIDFKPLKSNLNTIKIKKEAKVKLARGYGSMIKLIQSLVDNNFDDVKIIPLVSEIIKQANFNSNSDGILLHHQATNVNTAIIIFKGLLDNNLNPWSETDLFTSDYMEILKAWLVESATFVPLRRPQRRILFESIVEAIDRGTDGEFLVYKNDIREIFSMYHSQDYAKTNTDLASLMAKL